MTINSRATSVMRLRLCSSAIVTSRQGRPSLSVPHTAPYRAAFPPYGFRR